MLIIGLSLVVICVIQDARAGSDPMLSMFRRYPEPAYKGVIVGCRKLDKMMSDKGVRINTLDYVEEAIRAEVKRAQERERERY